eukprot:1982066-Pyramimonas_sp.AAC.1
MTPSQANQRQTWVFHPQHSRDYEVDYKAPIDPIPALEPPVAPWQIQNAIDDRLMTEKPRTAFDEANVKRQ